MQEDGSSKARSIRWLWPLLLSPLLIWGCWNARFFEIDDIQYIRNNPKLQSGASWIGLWDPRMDYIYIPLTFIAFRIEHAIADTIFPGLGESAWPTVIRITSLLMHIGAMVMLWRALRILRAGSAMASGIVAACALHPLVCQCVCWPMEQKTLFSALFGFAALGQYFRAQRTLQFAGAAGLYLLALLAKPAALGLLPVVICWEFLGRPYLDGTPGKRATLNELGRPALQILPWFIASVLAIVMQMSLVSDIKMPLVGGSLWTVCLTDVPVLWRYVVNLICPLWLAADYAIAPVQSPVDPKFLAAAAALGACVAVTFAFAEKSQRRTVAFGWLWFVGALGPVLNFVGKNNLMADCYVYYSAPAFWFVVALALKGVLRSIPAASRLRTGLFATAIGSALLAALSVAQGSLFASAANYYENSARVEPNSAMNHLVVAQFLRDESRRQAVAGDKNAEKALRNRELSELEAGIVGVNFDRTRLMTDSYIWLGRAYYEHGREKDALTMLEKARQSPQRIDREQSATVLRLKGLISFDAGDFEQATKYHDAALSLTPEKSSLWIDRTRALLAQSDKLRKAGDKDGAEKCVVEARAALTSLPENVPARKEVEKLLISK